MSCSLLDILSGFFPWSHLVLFFGQLAFRVFASSVYFFFFSAFLRIFYGHVQEKFFHLPAPKDSFLIDTLTFLRMLSLSFPHLVVFFFAAFEISFIFPFTSALFSFIYFLH